MREDKTRSAAVPELMQKAVTYHRAGRLQEAEVIYQSVLQQQPRHPQALYLLGMIVHQLGKNELAVELLEQAIQVNPNVPDFHNICGEAYRALQKLDLAIACYEKALTIKPDFVQAHNNLGVAFHMLGSLENAVASYEQALGIQPDIAEVHRNLGVSLQELGELEKAIATYEQALVLKPDYVEAHNNLGLCLQTQDRHAEAINCYESALAVNPDYADAYNNLGIAQYKLGQHQEAIDNYKQALDIRPEFAETYFNLGVVLNELRRHEDAIDHYEKAIAITPDYLDAFYNLGALYEKLNQVEKANIYVEKVFQIKADDPKASRLAAVLLKREEKYAEALEILKSISLIKADPETVSSIHFDMGKLYDLLDDSDAAFQQFTKANQLQTNSHEAKRFNKDAYLQQATKIRDQFDHNWIESWLHTEPGDEAEPLVFLVGFPRSGTTLLDQILDSHPGIQVIEEKPMIEKIVEKLSVFPGEYPAVLASLNERDIAKLRKEYMTLVDGHISREPGSTIIDKLPLNIIHIGLINSLFPRSRIILALRHPCDVCLSNFMQHYEINDAMANFFTLEDTVELYDQVMSLWREYVEILSLDYIEFRYESLLENSEAEIRPLLDFLQLDWDPSLLDYTNHAKKRGAINTPSYSQVTKPIYHQAKYRWQKYQQYLKPVMDRLESHITYFSY